jgi:hypothetical protein
MIKSLSLCLLLFFWTILPLEAQVVTSSESRTGRTIAGSIANPLNPNSTLQEGFVIITPTTGNGAGLVAYETIGDLQGLTFQTAVLPATTLTMSGAVIVDLSTGANSLTGPLSTLLGNNPAASAAAGALLPLFVNTGISVINPNLTPATINVSINTPSGAPISLPSLTIGPMHQVAKFVSEFMGSSANVNLPLVGVLTFTSNVPVAITALEFRGTAFSTVPVVNVSTASGTTSTAVVNNGSSTSTGSTISIPGLPILVPFPHLSSGVGGNGALVLPQFVMGGGWASRIVIANVSGTQQTVRVDFFGSDGLPFLASLGLQIGATFSNITISANGAVDLGPQDVTGVTIF